MSTPSLHTIPIELIHRIIDNLDVQTIFLAFRNVCQRFNTIVNTYNSYKLDFRLISKPKFHEVCRTICPDNVISLILSDEDETPGQIEFFLSLVDICQFIHLRSLTLIQVDDITLNMFLKNIVTNSLVSLSIDSTQFTHTTLALLSPAAERVDHTSMSTLKTSDSVEEHTYRSLQSFVEQLSVTNCSFEDYFNILRNLIHLEKLVLNNDWLRNNVQMPITPSNLTSSLKSLTIIEDHLSMDMCEALLSVSSLLTYLKMKVSTNADRSLYNGSTWKKIIETKWLVFN